MTEPSDPISSPGAFGSGELKSIKGEITKKVLKAELSFLYVTHHHDLFYITVKYHQNIPHGFQVIEWTQKWTSGSSLYPPNLLVGG